jgi:hypothetical protein
MSHSSAKVYFPDGLVLYGEFNGDGDVMQPTLYESITEVKEHWREGGFDVCEHDGEPVVIQADYAGGFHWTGRACGECRCVVEGWMPHEEEALVTQGDFHVYSAVSAQEGA